VVESLVCIGGPLDGTLLRSDRSTYECVEEPGLKPDLVERSASSEVSYYQRHLYYRDTASVGDMFLHFWRHAELTRADAIATVFRSYGSGNQVRIISADVSVPKYSAGFDRFLDYLKASAHRKLIGRLSQESDDLISIDIREKGSDVVATATISVLMPTNFASPRLASRDA
jgi:hypothetical protein